MTKTFTRNVRNYKGYFDGNERRCKNFPTRYGLWGLYRGLLITKYKVKCNSFMSINKLIGHMGSYFNAV